jgi:predicted ester cyclase
LDDLAFEVLDQVKEGDWVASRWVMTGSNAGRRVRLSGITISRLCDGLIVEDRSSFDTLELLRGLGMIRALRIAPRVMHAMRDAPFSDVWSR